MNKLIALLLALTLALALTACDKDDPTVPSTTAPTQSTTQPTEAPTHPTETPTQPTTVPTEPVHVCAAGTWDADLHNHWSTCIECGEAIPTGEHVLDAENFCTICNAEVWIYEDAESSVYIADAYSNAILCKYYDPSGALLYASSWMYIYDDAGIILSCLEYLDGALISHQDYDPETGNLRTLYSYNDDGSWEYSEYDAHTSMIRWISYKADGTVDFDFSYAYTYGEDGIILGEKTYENGILVFETEYAIFHEVDGFYTYPAKETVYYEDGSYTVTEYDENYQVISENHYAAGGTLVDSSDKFDAEACAPLFGTWQGEYIIDGSLIGSSLDIRCAVTMTFDDKGVLCTYTAVNMEDMKLALTDMIYSTYAACGYSKEETDAMFQTDRGMTVEEYVLASLETTDIMDTTQMLWEVYYVEDGLLYSGASWTSYMESSAFSIDGDTLTLSACDESGIETVLVLTKTAE